ncbi:MAG: septum formation protein Maf [Ruminococcus sp.]|nr:septum formation protein Maf [Ruminococcus sp.]
MIVLASNSPRRKQLMRLISPSFIIDPADIEESHAENIPLDRMPEFLALQKAQQVQKKHPDDIVIGCDTGVFINNMMIGKPSSDKTAFEILKMLSGKTHRVITGCAIYKGGKKLSFSEVTEVEFYPLSNEEIKEYIATGEPSDKAGAYGIQGKGSLLIKGIRGDYFNVVGLPVARLSRALKEFIE